MTAHELAKQLLELPDVMLTVRGYEGGVDEITSVSQPKELALNVHEEWYYGKHEYVDPGYNSDDVRDKQVTIAIHIG